MKHLKLVIAVLILSTFSTVSTFAQSQSPEITIVQSVDLSADAVWTELRKLDNIAELSSMVEKVKYTGNKGVGGERVCTAPDGKGQFKESIVSFSDGERTYSYAVTEGIPATNMINNFKVVDLGYNKSMIVWTSSFKFIENPNMNEEQFRNFLNGAATEMIANTVKFAAGS